MGVERSVSCSEHYVIHVLRDDPAFVPELDFVMAQDGRLIGQNMFMKTVIEADDGRIIDTFQGGYDEIKTFGNIWNNQFVILYRNGCFFSVGLSGI